MKIKGSKDFFYIEVDTELVVRNMIFFVLFCIITGAGVNYLLWPSINKYKMQYIEEKKMKIIFTQVKKDFDSEQAKLRNTKNTNQKFLDIMSYSFAQNRLENLLSKYFQNVEITKKSSITDDKRQVTIDEYSIKGEIPDTKTMNNFFADIKNAPMSIKVLLPIMIKKSNSSNGLVFEFLINVEKSNYTPDIAL